MGADRRLVRGSKFMLEVNGSKVHGRRAVEESVAREGHFFFKKTFFNKVQKHDFVTEKTLKLRETF